MTVQRSKPNRPIHQPMNTSVPKAEVSKAEALTVEAPTVESESEVVDALTPDSYDPHIIPAETAARKDHEGAKFKHLDPHPAGSDSIDESKGFTVDKEGLLDNFAIEPVMYYDAPGDADKKKLLEDNEQPNQLAL
jgi:hypothetical protein